MINGAHVIIFSGDPAADRSFLRDVLGFPHVDAGDDWLIFKLPPAEAAVHPTGGPGAHELYFMCDDVEASVAELTAKGRRVHGADHRSGVGTADPVPAAGRRR